MWHIAFCTQFKRVCVCVCVCLYCMDRFVPAYNINRWCRALWAEQMIEQNTRRIEDRHQQIIRQAKRDEKQEYEMSLNIIQYTECAKRRRLTHKHTYAQELIVVRTDENWNNGIACVCVYGTKRSHIFHVGLNLFSQELTTIHERIIEWFRKVKIVPMELVCYTY